MDINALYNEWLEKATSDPDLKAELESITKFSTDFTEALNSAPQACVA